MNKLVNRLIRYRDYIDQRFIEDLTRNKEYSLSLVKPELRTKIESGEFRTIVFTGMGCSAIVSDLIRGFFAVKAIPIQVLVINDYDFRYSLPAAVTESPSTLFVISSYSGFSEEPIRAYDQIKEQTRNILLLTSGGRLKEIGERDDVSILLWQLKDPDREYPLLHVPQYFSIVLDAFCQLGILSTNYQDDLREAAHKMRIAFNDIKLAHAREFAEKITQGETVLLATPKWYEALLKIVKMHLNEIAMVPAHRNSFHEFCHSEVAVFGDQKPRRNILIFRDPEEDDYTRRKMANLAGLFDEVADAENGLRVMEYEVQGANFIEQIFSCLLFISYVTYYLGVHHNKPSRDLISQAAGNPWYSSAAIQRERGLKREAYDVAL